MNDASFFRPRRRRRQAEEREFVPLFFDDLNVTDAVEMECEGNPQCILDLIATGEMEFAMTTLNHEKETNLTEDTISETSVIKTYNRSLHFLLFQQISHQLFQLVPFSVLPWHKNQSSPSW